MIMLNEYVIREIDSFIIDVFNYYNGKINMINKAILRINWNRQTQELGITTLPNIINICPCVAVSISSNIILLKINLLETIIHELYHADQIINYQLYHKDPMYKHNIETAVEVETLNYIMQHRFEIARRFSIPTDNMDTNDYNLLVENTYCNYYRRNWTYHITMVISGLIGCEYFDTIYHLLCKYINNTIELEINNVCVKIIDRGVQIPLEVFNASFDYGIWESSYHFINYKMGMEKNSDIFKISILVESKNMMVRTV